MHDSTHKTALSLQEKLELLPKEPGCYLFKDERGKVIYVGKAKVLRSRVRSYFTGVSDGRTQFSLLVSKIRDVETIITDNEVEALILEANLIRRHRPRYNVDVRDDRSYPYLKVTRELYPKVYLTRDPRNDKALYFGPLSDVTRVKSTVNALRQACHIRTCNLMITRDSVKKGKHKVCLEYHMGNCLGPCEGLQNPEDYSESLRRLIDVVQGRGNALIQRLEERMKEYSRHRKFEEAAKVRDQLAAVNSLTQRQKVVSIEEQERDVFGIAREDKDGCIAVLRIRAGKLIGRSHSYLSRLHTTENDGDIWVKYLANYYLSETRIRPREVHLPGPLDDEQIELIESFLNKNQDRRIYLCLPQRGDKVRMLEMAQHNAELLLTEYRIAKERRDREPMSLKALQETLQLDHLPVVIECFDNSNLMGTNPVSSMVRFRNARPEKSQYRHYKVKTVRGIDDFASMSEVVGRRYRRLLREKQPLPDLVVIDGGLGQVNAARRILNEIGLRNLPCIGLAKRLEEIIQPGQPGPITLPKTSSALKLLMCLRDEAHRFAITFHRKLRAKSQVSSTLTNLPGIGEAKAKALLKHFGSLKRLKEATPEAIAEVPGFSKKGGQVLLDLLNSDSD